MVQTRLPDRLRSALKTATGDSLCPAAAQWVLVDNRPTTVGIVHLGAGSIRAAGAAAAGMLLAEGQYLLVTDPSRPLTITPDSDPRHIIQAAAFAIGAGRHFRIDHDRVQFPYDTADSIGSLPASWIRVEDLAPRLGIELIADGVSR